VEEKQQYAQLSIVQQHSLWLADFNCSKIPTLWLKINQVLKILQFLL